jgi:3-oxoacyl-[acyl-carrier-protein] synthase II
VILESRSHAESRGAEIRARLLGHGRFFGGDARGATSRSTGAERSTGIERSRVIERSIAGALRSAGLAPRDVGFVCAHGLGTIEDDPLEAQAIRAVLNDAPVTALKSYFGNLGAGSAVVELIGGLLGLAHGAVPVTLNYEQPDPACPVNVVHAQPVRPASSVFVSLCQAQTGQAVAIAIGAP